MDERTERPRLPQGERLPDLRLAAAAGGRPEPLVAPGGRQVQVVVAVEGADCAACRAYLQRVAEADAEIRAWDGRVVVVVPAEADEAARLADGLDPPLMVLADPERRLSRHLRIPGVAVLVADPWGEVRFRQEAGAGHELPEPAELADWVRFVAIQCPECEGEAL
jgi:peroxiredoxin